MRSLVTGTPVEVHDGFDADAAIDAAGRGATLVSLVTRALNQVSPTLFRTVLIGGAAPPPDRPANVIATYGMTETGSGVVYDTTPLDGLEIRLADDGEIQLRGPMLFRGYRSGPSPFLADGWFPTGDLGSWSDEGHLVVAGRRGDVIVTGGEKVWPDPVERLLLARPDVAQVALIGRADKDWGHRVVAVIVTETGHRPPELDSIRATVAEDLPVWAAPKELEFVDDLPRTSLGKVKRNLL
jgi:O-succinylbenzoic acid--CoA ligase